jgi:Transglycosylase SLT domain/NlpC/P60 family
VAPAPSAGSGAGQAAAYSRLSALLANGNQPPAFLIPIYKAAGRRYHVPWRILAAINWIESDYGRNVSTSSAGAIGWMQFMPSTWSEYGVDVDHHGQPNPYNPRDAIFAAARYLAANGARNDLRKAIFGYNHATWYVDEVIARAAVIVGHPLHAGPRARQKLRAMRMMARLLNGDPYIWGGGHGDWQLEPGYDCSGFVSTVLHAGGYLSAPQTTQTLPSQPEILPGPGRLVTIFDRTDAGLGDDHVIIDLGGQWWESGGSSADGGTASVHRIDDVSPTYLATFNEILHPRGL